MQVWQLDFSLVKFKMQIKIQCKDLLTFSFFSISNGFAIFQLFTINSWMQCNICIYIYIYIYIYDEFYDEILNKITYFYHRCF